MGISYKVSKDYLWIGRAYEADGKTVYQNYVRGKGWVSSEYAKEVFKDIWDDTVRPSSEGEASIVINNIENERDIEDAFEYWRNEFFDK